MNVDTKRLKRILIKTKDVLIFHIPMRLYFICKTCGQKFYISNIVKIRSDLPPLFYLTCPYKHVNKYIPREIFADTSEGNIAIGGALAGGLIGLLAGGVGAIVGAILGMMAGGKREKQDIEDVDKFNRS